MNTENLVQGAEAAIDGLLQVQFDRKTRMARLLSDKPTVNSILKIEGTTPVNVTVQIKPDRGRGETLLMFVHARVNEGCTAWVLSDCSHGLVCLILPDSQEKLWRQKKYTGDMSVVALRVIGFNKNRTALKCEIVEQ